ncbi:myrosinase 1-like [Aricia agestis]|uniref:myrosinase 1-like n=1 Tax=Aricia agestis TaxID=91739 RepID=UPI001C2066BC|nr:myrosinase 1-like [Aricia agestis]
MKLLYYLAGSTLLAVCMTYEMSSRTLPENLLLGIGSSAYQYEGAWDTDGRGPCIWDSAAHSIPSFIKDGSTADVTVDFYHHYKDDIQIMKEMGLQFVKISISWTRILPTGYSNKVNLAGIDFYNNVIDELIENNIIPLVTLYHWDLPQIFQDMGGWTNVEIVNLFEDFARVVFDNFGDRVKLWSTINEPLSICAGYESSSVFAPFLELSGTGSYLCAKNMLLAHARVYRLYDENYRQPQQGKIGIIFDAEWYEPLTDSAEDRQAAADYLDFQLGIYANPIFSSTGDFPSSVKEMVGAKSLAQGFIRSRLPELSDEEIEFIKGSADYFGINLYSNIYVYRNASVYTMYSSPSSDDDAGVGQVTDNSWSDSGYTDGNTQVPCSFYKLLMKIKELYNDPIILITENGLSTDGGLDDYDRLAYIRGYLNGVVDAIEDGCNVLTYAVWSLFDNFEWSQGYTRKYGLFEVDFTSPNRTRTARESALFYRYVATTRILDRNTIRCGLHTNL